MNFNNKLKTGLYLASHSFALLWHHKVLFVYFIINVGILILMNVLTAPYSNIMLLFRISGFNLYSWEFIPWIRFFSHALLNFLLILTSSILSVSLINHVHALIHRDYAINIKQCIKNALSKIIIILIWTLISTIIVIGLEQCTANIVVGTMASKFIIALITLLSWFWALLTLLVLPVIALEKITILQALLKSKDIVQQVILEIIGGELWIGLIAILSFFPFLILQILISTFILPRLVILFLAPIIATGMILLNSIFSTVHTIFKTILYHYYTQPIEELQGLRYPRF